MDDHTTTAPPNDVSPVHAAVPVSDHPSDGSYDTVSHDEIPADYPSPAGACGHVDPLPAEIRCDNDAPAPRIAVAMMVRDEAHRICMSLDSAIGIADSVILYDTGSVDDTVDVALRWGVQNKTRVWVKRGTFVDFSVSRNVLLDFADEWPGEFLLLMDCSDVIQIADDALAATLADMDANGKNAMLVTQKWLYVNEITKYKNTRLVRTRKNWRYERPIHEYITSKSDPTHVHQGHAHDGLVMFQDRNLDEGKSAKRYARDREVLERIVAENNDSRDVFYLAQTYNCLGMRKEAVDTYLRRAEMRDGFWEERYHSLERAARTSRHSLKIFENVVEYSVRATLIDYRVEAMLTLAECIYVKYQQSPYRDTLLRVLLDVVASLDRPIGNTLFVADNEYTTTRWDFIAGVSKAIRYKGGLKAVAANTDKPFQELAAGIVGEGVATGFTMVPADHAIDTFAGVVEAMVLYGPCNPMLTKAMVDVAKKYEPNTQCLFPHELAFRLHLLAGNKCESWLCNNQTRVRVKCENIVSHLQKHAVDAAPKLANAGDPAKAVWESARKQKEAELRRAGKSQKYIDTALRLLKRTMKC